MDGNWTLIDDDEDSSWTPTTGSSHADIEVFSNDSNRPAGIDDGQQHVATVSERSGSCTSLSSRDLHSDEEASCVDDNGCLLLDDILSMAGSVSGEQEDFEVALTLSSPLKRPWGEKDEKGPLPKKSKSCRDFIAEILDQQAAAAARSTDGTCLSGSSALPSKAPQDDTGLSSKTTEGQSETWTVQQAMTAIAQSNSHEMKESSCKMVVMLTLTSCPFRILHASKSLDEMIQRNPIGEPLSECLKPFDNGNDDERFVRSSSSYASNTNNMLKLSLLSKNSKHCMLGGILPCQAKVIPVYADTPPDRPCDLLIYYAVIVHDIQTEEPVVVDIPRSLLLDIVC